MRELDGCRKAVVACWNTYRAAARGQRCNLCINLRTDVRLGGRGISGKSEQKRDKQKLQILHVLYLTGQSIGFWSAPAS